MSLKGERKHNTFKRSFQQRAFPYVRAGGSLNRGFSYEEAGVLNKLGTSVIASSGKQKKEPRFFFTPTFYKQNSGFYLFTGYELRGVLWKK
jgi:hypothetical protein